MRTVAQACWALFVAGLAAGCSTPKVEPLYPGVARPDAELALLSVPYEISVLDIDGARVPSPPHFSQASERKFSLLPGHHEVTGRFYSPWENDDERRKGFVDRSNPVTMSFEAQAGRHYEAAFDTSGARGVGKDQVALFVREKDSSRKVSTEKPAPVEALWQSSPKPEAPERAAPASPAVKTDGEKAAQKPPQITPLDNLKQWWFYATEDEKKAFRAWMDKP
jgi:hypothetical protein